MFNTCGRASGVVGGGLYSTQEVGGRADSRETGVESGSRRRPSVRLSAGQWIGERPRWSLWGSERKSSAEQKSKSGGLNASRCARGGGAGVTLRVVCVHESFSGNVGQPSRSTVDNLSCAGQSRAELSNGHRSSDMRSRSLRCVGQAPHETNTGTLDTARTRHV